MTVTTMIGKLSGMKIDQKVRKNPAPSTLAAFTNSCGTVT
jgi:hypothetical protein